MAEGTAKGQTALDQDANDWFPDNETGDINEEKLRNFVKNLIASFFNMEDQTLDDIEEGDDAKIFTNAFKQLLEGYGNDMASKFELGVLEHNHRAGDPFPPISNGVRAFKITLEEDILLSVGDPKAGLYSFELIQDANGARTITLQATKWYGDPPSFSDQPNEVDILLAYWNKERMYILQHIKNPAVI